MDSCHQVASSALSVGYATVIHQGHVLFLDPLTGLAAYPGFEAYVIERLGGLLGHEVHVAIGDVDDLTGYVTTVRTEDPTMFGHLAGNACMRRVGEATRVWVNGARQAWPLVVTGTFGGDEVIIFASGVSAEVFGDSVFELVELIRQHAPRPCSLAYATAVVGESDEPETVYRHVVSCVDAALFSLKMIKRSQGEYCDGDVLDMGRVGAVAPSADEVGPAIVDAVNAHDRRASQTALIAGESDS